MKSLLSSTDLSQRESLGTTGKSPLTRFPGPNLFAGFFKQNDDNGVVEGQVMDVEADVSGFEKYNPLIHIDKNVKIMSRDFVKKYIAYAKNMDCNLTDESSQYITKKWTDLRVKDFEYAKNKGGSRVIPVTVRTLESLIRLATAHAKVRLSSEVAIRDCDEAYNLISKTLFDEDREEPYSFMTIDLKTELKWLLKGKGEAPWKKKNQQRRSVLER
jgi:DNA replicative helicase MCM subunit Mcm2 (Cdc46/Mcm family)